MPTSPKRTASVAGTEARLHAASVQAGAGAAIDVALHTLPLLRPFIPKRMLDAGVAELWNMYGPTETTVWSTLARITDPEHITVGRPIDATVVRLLDEQGRECGVGEPGEICIGGAGVAQAAQARASCN